MSYCKICDREIMNVSLNYNGNVICKDCVEFYGLGNLKKVLRAKNG